MSVCWISLLLLGFCLSLTESLSICGCPDQLKIVCVPVGGNVSVPCPNQTAEEVTFALFMGQELIASYTSDLQNNATRSAEKIVNIKEGVELHRDAKARSVSFVLAGVTAWSPGNYSCEAMITFPPPILKVHNASRILVLLEGHQCMCNADCDAAPIELRGQTPLWIWVLGFAAVCAYGLIVTIVAFVNWLRLRRAESQSDYMNTKPIAPKGHRKKRGVQQPVPRHF